MKLARAGIGSSGRTRCGSWAATSWARASLPDRDARGQRDAQRPADAARRGRLLELRDLLIIEGAGHDELGIDAGEAPLGFRCDQPRLETSNHPRLAFARYDGLYKLYVIRRIPPAVDSLAEDPCTELLRLLLPELDRVLFGKHPTSSAEGLTLETEPQDQ